MKNILLIVLFFGFNYSLKSEEIPFVRGNGDRACNEIIKNFINPTVLKLEVKSGSLFFYDKTLINRIDELKMRDMNLLEFYNNFEMVNHRAPSLREAIQFNIDEKIKILKKYDALISDLGKRNSQEHMNLTMLLGELQKSRNKVDNFKSVDQLNNELKEAYKNNKTTIKDLDDVILLGVEKDKMFIDEHYTYIKNKTVVSNFQGEYGELIALAAANEKILARGLTFKSDKSNIKSYSRDVSMLVDSLEVKLNNMPEEEIVLIVKKHGKGLLRDAQAYINETPQGNTSKEILINKVMGMVRTKEIDLIFVDSKGNYVWAEVKGYGVTITKEIIASNFSKKSVYQQLVEHQAMADVLGLNNVRFRFISPISAVDPEASKLIASLGYEVVAAK